MNPKPFRVLVVDDDEDDRFFIASAMASCGIDTTYVHFAEDGDEALTLLQMLDARSELPNLMLLDLNMPRMNGHEVIEALRASDMISRLAVVVMTTSENDNDVRRVYSAGGHSYIAKPSTFDRLVQVMSCLQEYLEATVQPSYFQY